MQSVKKTFLFLAEAAESSSMTDSVLLGYIKQWEDQNIIGRWGKI